jgi:predicted RND superfamily exporter protein
VYELLAVDCNGKYGTQEHYHRNRRGTDVFMISGGIGFKKKYRRKSVETMVLCIFTMWILVAMALILFFKGATGVEVSTERNGKQ